MFVLQSLEESIHTLTVKITHDAINRPDAKLPIGFRGIDCYSAILFINEMGPIRKAEQVSEVDNLLSDSFHDHVH